MKIGDKVVCIDNSPSKCPCCLGKNLSLIKNNIYVIKGFSEIDMYGIKGLFLIGVKHNHNNILNDIFGYNIARFRLLDEMKEEARQKQKLITGIPNIAEFKY